MNKDTIVYIIVGSVTGIILNLYSFFKYKNKRSLVDDLNKKTEEIDQLKNYVEHLLKEIEKK